MKKYTLSLCFIFYSFLLFSQYEENRNYQFFTRLGLNTFNELNIYYHSGELKSTNLSLGLAFKYGPSFLDHCGLLDPRPLRLDLEKRGPIARVGFDKRYENMAGIYRFAFYLEGRFFKANDFLVDEGCHSGSSEGRYEKYDVNSKELFIRFFYDRPSKNGVSNFYWSIAGGRKYVVNSYSEFGSSYNSRMPSDRLDKFWDWSWTIDFGYRIGFSSYKK